MQRSLFLVDGFNLYHALAGSKQLRQYKWLNLRSLCTSIISSREQITDILFCTAFYPGKPERRQRHQTYLRALGSVGIFPIFGEFKRKDKYCQLCHSHFVGYEEKQTDVNIAIELLARAVNDLYDTAFIVSGDSDLLPAIRAVKKIFPQKTIKLVIPPNRNADALKHEVHSYMRLKERHLKNNQFPEAIFCNGIVIKKPETW